MRLKISDLAEQLKTHGERLDKLTFKVGELTGAINGSAKSKGVTGKDILKWVVLPLILVLGGLIGLDMTEVMK